MHQLNLGNDNRGIPELFEGKHDVAPCLDVPMILFNQVVQIFRGSKLPFVGQKAISFHFGHRAMERRVADQGNGLRCTALAFDRLLEKAFAAVTSRLAVSLKSTVLPARSTAL